MRRIPGLALAVSLILAACGEPTQTLLQDLQGEGDAAPATRIASEIHDGTSSAPDANPHFYFLPPIAPSTPSSSGLADDGLEPAVTVCPIESWTGVEAECSSPLAVFAMDDPDADDLVRVDPGSGYGASWKTSRYPAADGQVYRIAVSVVGKLLGYADVKAYDQQTYSSFQHTDPAGYVAISTNGTLNIRFRIEEGALEAEYCDPTSVEDCDVALVTYDQGACLRVFNDPGETGELLGSEACVPAGGTLEGEPVTGTYAAILTLEQPGVTQGGVSDPSWQVPYFPDFTTDPPGISFDPAGPGVNVVICQALEGPGTIDEELHPFLRPFLIFSDGTVYLPEDYSYGAPECEGFMPHQHASAAGGHGGNPQGIFARLGRGLSRVSALVLPRPLMARRLHGGLNTTVYDTRKPPSDGLDDGEGGGDNAPAFELATEEVVVELGAVLDLDLEVSFADVPGTGLVGSQTVVTINVLNALAEPFPFAVPVEVTVSGANAATVDATYMGAGVYQAAYTPTAPGADQVAVLVDGDPLASSPYPSEVAPLGPSAANSSFQISASEAGSPTTVTVTVKDGNGDSYVHGAQWPIDVVVSVTGANAVSTPALDDDGNGGYDGVYVASYTPQQYGASQVTVTIEGETVGTQSFTTAPRPADPTQSTVSAPEGLVQSPTTVSVVVKNTAGEVYDYGAIRPIAVQVGVSGANTASFAATDPDGDGTYQGSYTPLAPGTDQITATIDGAPVSNTATSQVAPLSGDIRVEVAITGAGVAPEDGLPVQLYSGTLLLAETLTDASGLAVFSDVDFGSYTVHLPKRDFDAQFAVMTQPLDHQTAPSVVTFQGTSAALPSGVSVYRVRNGGSGNAYRYVLDNQSWVSSEKKAQSPVLLGVTPHLATIHSPGENAHVTGLVAAVCSGDLSRCKSQGWIGLSDDALEGTYVWITGEPFGFQSWDTRQPSTKNNDDHVEINPLGKWSTTNGASSTNDGYVQEWKVTWPQTPPF